jgi:penicillin amidase
VDVYRLELHPDDPERYRHAGEWRQIERRSQRIRPRGAPSLTADALRSHYGPIVSWDEEHGVALAECSSFWKREPETIEAFHDLLWARSFDDARAAVARIVTSHNMFVASADGHVGFWFAGRHPIRREGHDWRFIQPGDGSMDWTGFLSFEEIPHAVDPPAGIVANWNNRPTRAWTPFPQGRVFAGWPLYEALDARRAMSLDDTWEAAAEAWRTNGLARAYLAPLRRFAESSSVRDHRRAAAYLADWNGRTDADSPAPLVFREWVATIFQSAFRPVLGSLALSAEAAPFLLDPLDDLLRGEDAPQPLRHDYLRGRDIDDFVLAALDVSLTRLRETRGEDMGAWRDTVLLRQAEGEQAIEIPAQAPTYAIAVEMSDPPRVRTLLAVGQSERPDSPHFADRAACVQTWTGYNWRWEEEDR